MTYLLTVSTKRWLRKPFVEMFKGDWKSEDEVRRVVVKYRSKAQIINIEEIQVLSSSSGKESRAEAKV